MLDARSQQIARAPHDSMHSVIFLQEQFRQIGTVLASDSGNQGNFLGLFHLRIHRVSPSFVIIKRGNNQAYWLFERQTQDFLSSAKSLVSTEQRILAAHPVWCAKVFSYLIFSSRTRARGDSDSLIALQTAQDSYPPSNELRRDSGLPLLAARSRW